MKASIALVTAWTATLLGLGCQSTADPPPRPLAWRNGSVIYPYHAVVSGIEGEVGIAVKFDSAGFATSVKVVKPSGHALLDQAATASAALWVLERNLPAAKRDYELMLQFKITDETRNELPMAPVKSLGATSREKLQNRELSYRVLRAIGYPLSGVTGVRFRISDKGYVTECWVMKSSGSLQLDAAAVLSTFQISADEGMMESVRHQPRVVFDRAFEYHGTGGHVPTGSHIRRN